MADTIKIGNIDASYFKVGSGDCSIYLGDTLLYPPTPVVKNYFRFVAREDGQFKLSGNSLSYSTDSGSTWTILPSNTYSPMVESGSTIMFKATSPALIVDAGIGNFISTGQFDVEGNIMSLVYGDNFETATTLTNHGWFRSLFDKNTNVINASGLTLPSTNAPQNAYRSLFHSCTNLVTAPALPATTLADSCYKYAFRYCTSLTTPPALPATNISQSCYANMFQGCTSLTTAPALPATTVYTQCYENMFSGCTSLTTAPVLPASTLANNCYHNMFSRCSSLSAITCLATDISATDCTKYWVATVANRGTFTKAASMTGWATGASGIPNGWTVQDYQPTPTGQTWVTIQAGEFIPEGSYADLRVSSGTIENINDDEYMSIYVDDAYPYITFGSLCTEKQCPEGEEECNCLEEDPETGECIEYDENDCWCNTELECLSHSIGWANTMNEYFDYINEVLYPFTYDNEGYWHMNTPFDVEETGDYTATFDIEVLPATE